MKKEKPWNQSSNNATLFLPCIGYSNLISSADIFVIYDNIKYTKKGLVNKIE